MDLNTNEFNKYLQELLESIRALKDQMADTQELLIDVIEDLEELV